MMHSPTTILIGGCDDSNQTVSKNKSRSYCHHYFSIYILPFLRELFRSANHKAGKR